MAVKLFSKSLWEVKDVQILRQTKQTQEFPSTYFYKMTSGHFANVKLLLIMVYQQMITTFSGLSCALQISLSVSQRVRHHFVFIYRSRLASARYRIYFREWCLETPLPSTSQYLLFYNRTAGCREKWHPYMVVDIQLTRKKAFFFHVSDTNC